MQKRISDKMGRVKQSKWLSQIEWKGKNTLAIQPISIIDEPPILLSGRCHQITTQTGARQSMLYLIPG